VTNTKTMKNIITLLGLFAIVNTQLIGQIKVNSDSLETLEINQSMKILAIERDIDGADWNSAKEILEDEARHVYQFYLKGIIREIYFTENKNAILILECSNKEVARDLLNTMPLVQKGFTRFELMELRPYTGFTRLMNLQ